MTESIRSLLKKSIRFSADQAKRFFKTGKGHYAEKDQFSGIPVPSLRKIAKTFAHLEWKEIQRLLRSKINEERLLALFILVGRYQKAKIGSEVKDKIYQFYLRHLKQVNNWNLVDSSAHWIIGAHLWKKERTLLLKLAQSKNLWERRIAIVATWYFIKKEDLQWTFKISKLLLKDTHDLIHKAVGWMLREAGKKDPVALSNFLDQYSTQMPRTMLRYAIEKFSTDRRKKYLLKN